MPREPIRVALVNDYEIVLAGMREMLAPYSDRLQVVEVDTDSDVVHEVDVVLYDTYGQERSAVSSARQALRCVRADKVALFTWTVTPELTAAATSAGLDALLCKSMDPDELASSLMLIASGRKIFPSLETQATRQGGGGDLTTERRGGSDWPGRSEGLTMREAEMITLISMGLRNAEIAERTYLSPNSVKSYIRSAYRKIGVARRSQAVAWGLDHDMIPHRSRPLA